MPSQGSSSSGGRGKPVGPKLELHHVGSRPRLHVVAVQLWTSTGTLTGVTVRLRRGPRLR